MPGLWAAKEERPPPVRRRDRGETDAIVRRMLGYSRVFEDPPDERASDPEQVRVRMGWLLCGEFADLNRRLTAGEPLPEVWDIATRFRPRTRGNSPGWRYIYPPGQDGPTPSCVCDWINPFADETACRRCHTIRVRIDG